MFLNSSSGDPQPCSPLGTSAIFQDLRSQPARVLADLLSGPDKTVGGGEREINKPSQLFFLYRS